VFGSRFVTIPFHINLLHTQLNHCGANE
jgi:hypothetical protein